MLTRRKFLCAAAFSSVALTGYARLIESNWLDIGFHEISFPAPPEAKPVKILHLSDLHASPSVNLDFIKQAVETGIAQKPDLICLTGDYITDGQYDNFEAYARIARLLPNAAPTFASLGNHDVVYKTKDSSSVRRWIAESGISLLSNASTELGINGWRIRLVGIDDPTCGRPDLNAAFSKVTADDSAIIVLSHNPDTKAAFKKFRWHLMLSGHTHGGQVCIPFVGPLATRVKDRRFVAGLYTWEDRRIHITRGVGSSYGVRFNCRPEVSIISLNPLQRL